jgi:hypothetical protein
MTNWLTLLDFAQRTSTPLKTLQNKLAACQRRDASGIILAELDGVLFRKFLGRWHADFSSWQTFPVELVLEQAKTQRTGQEKP